MKKWLGYLLFLLCCYILFLIGTLPASLLYHHTKERVPGVVLETIEGTIWDGKAKQIRINNLQTGPIYWRFKPLSLLLGRAEFQLSTTGKELKATGSAGVNLFGKLVLSSLKGESSVATILSLMTAPAITPEGRVHFDLEEVVIRDQRLNSVTGTIDWRGAGVKQPIEIQVGNLNMVLNTDNSGIHGKISDKGATIGVNGQLELQQDGAYQIKGKIEPKPDTPQDLINALGMLGNRDPTGAISLNYSGKF